MWSLIAQTVDFIVHIDLVRNEDRRRRPPTRQVTSIIEIGGLGERGGLATTEVWGDRRAAASSCRSAPLSSRHLQRLRLAGYDPRMFAPTGASVMTAA